MKPTILIIEDEERIAHWLRSYLEKANFQTLVCHDGLIGLETAEKHKPDLVILDLMLPGLDGLEVCKGIRKTSDVPIIMLTAKGTEIDKILGLELGADDYVTKPFSPNEVVARVRAVLRRQKRDETEAAVLERGPISLDTDAFSCQVNGESVKLSRTQFALLETLMRNSGRALSRQQLLDAAFTGDYDGFERTIDVHIRRLRSRIEPDPANPSHITTVFGIGYKFLP